MGSRIDKYYNDSINESYDEHVSSSTRSERNARLYKQVYGKYGDLDNLPIDDNTDEIDMESLRELVANSNKQEEKVVRESLNILEQKKRNIDEQRVYDINKILEKAKYDNNKLKDTMTNVPKINHSILTTLGSNELSLEEVRKANENYSNDSVSQNIVISEEKIISKSNDEIEENLSMTREMKYKNLLQLKEDNSANQDNYHNNFNNNASLLTDSLDDDGVSLDMFEDLKPIGNTIVTKPIREDSLYMRQVKSDFRSSDTRDIDIIKEDTKEENDFFTSSYEFNKNDFAVDEDFEDLKNKGGILKIILLIFAITVFVGVIIYFVGTYGLGI